MSDQTVDRTPNKLLIEPREFARRGEIRSGTLPIESLPRVAEQVVGTQPLAIAWRAEGSVGDGIVSGAQGWFLKVAVSGSAQLRCERCLDPVEVPIAFERQFLMVPESQPLPDEELEEDRYDAIPVGLSLDLRELIEDELLLGLPQSPRHEQCALPGRAGDDEKKSPFAVLAQLKRGH